MEFKLSVFPNWSQSSRRSFFVNLLYYWVRRYRFPSKMGLISINTGWIECLSILGYKDQERGVLEKFGQASEVIKCPKVLRRALQPVQKSSDRKGGESPDPGAADAQTPGAESAGTKRASRESEVCGWLALIRPGRHRNGCVSSLRVSYQVEHTTNCSYKKYILSIVL